MAKNMRSRIRRQRGVSLVEMIVALGIMAAITPALSLVVIQLVRVPDTTSASLMTSYDATYASECITSDASCAETWTPGTDPSYGIFSWTDAAILHEIRYYYSPDDQALRREESLGGVVQSDTIIAKGLSDYSDVVFTLESTVSVQIEMQVAQEASGKTVSQWRTFHAAMRAASADFLPGWQFRRPITINNASETALTDYPVLLEPYDFPWDLEAEVTEGHMLNDGDDIRLVQEDGVYELGITITGAGTPSMDCQVKIQIDGSLATGTDLERNILAHMANTSGADIRFLSSSSVGQDPYAKYDAGTGALPFWIQERTDSSLIAWVKVHDVNITQIFMCYGDPTQTNKSSLVNTFTLSQFQDLFDFNDPTKITSTTSNVPAFAGDARFNPTSVVTNRGLNSAPGTGWTFESTHDRYTNPDASHGYSTGWFTEGTYSYKMNSDTNTTYMDGSNAYCRIYQAGVDLTYVDTITFDANLAASDSTWFTFTFRINGNVEWTEPMPSVATNYINKSIDISGKGYGAGCTLEFRVTNGAWALGHSQDFMTAYIDNIRVDQYGQIVSADFPTGASRFAVGSQITWNQDNTLAGTRWIEIHVYGYHYVRGWEEIPDSLLPGNAAGFTTSPIDISMLTPDYEQIRLVADLYTQDQSQSPRLQDWTVSYRSRQNPTATTALGSEGLIELCQADLLDYYFNSADLAQWNLGSDVAQIWVKIPYLPVGDTVIYCYYGNTSATYAGADPSNPGAVSSVTDHTFLDPFNNGSYVTLDNLKISSGRVEVSKGDNVVLNPNFTMSDSWIFNDNDDDLFGGYASDWNGTQCAKLWSREELIIWDTHYTEVRQDIDLSDVRQLIFDARTNCEDPNYFVARVLINGADAGWNKAMDPDTEYFNQVIDVAGLGVTGICTVSFRVECIQDTSIFDSQWMFAWFDNIRTEGYTSGTGTSDAIPADQDIVEGNEFTWTDTEVNGTVTYHVEYSADGGGTWADVPNAIIPGNSVGFRTATYPTRTVSLANINPTNTPTYDKIRIVANVTWAPWNANPTSTLQDWTVTYSETVPLTVTVEPFTETFTDSFTGTGNISGSTDVEVSGGNVQLGPSLSYTTYDYSSGIRHASYCDVDAMSPDNKTKSIANNLNEHLSASDIQYTALSASDDSRWVTSDPGFDDEVFMWFQMPINEAPGSITNIELRFEGYCAAGASDFSIYAYNNGTALWVQQGLVQNIAAGGDSTMTRTITAPFANYLDSTNLNMLDWGVYCARSDNPIRVDYVRVAVTTATGNTTYDFASVKAGEYCDVDGMNPDNKSKSIANNLNSHLGANDTQYTALSASDNSRWVTSDPGFDDEVFMWFQMPVNDASGSITNIELVFEGYCAAGASDFRIYAYNNSTASWEPIGLVQNIAAGGDSTMTRSITANFANYIDSSNLNMLDWGVYCARSDEVIRVDYVKVVVTIGGAGYQTDGDVTSVTFPIDTSTRFANGLTLSWNDSTQVGIDEITYQLLYNNGGSWDPIPEAALPGNMTVLPGNTTAGFTNSGVALSTVTPDYAQIRLKAYFTSTGAATPVLSDWTVSYYSRNYTLPEPSTSGGAEEASTLTDWPFRRPVTINNTSGAALSDYQVKITMDTQSLISAGKMQADGSDLRFALTDVSSELPYWIESGINTASTEIWVRLPSIPTVSSTMYVYYGNAGATAGSSAGATFGSGEEESGAYEDIVGFYSPTPVV